MEIDGVEVNEGETIVLHNGKLVLSAPSLEQALLGFLEKANAQDFELLTIFYGADLNHQEVNRLADKVRRIYSEQEIEIQEGGQPHYHFIISLE